MRLPAVATVAVMRLHLTCCTFCCASSRSLQLHPVQGWLQPEAHGTGEAGGRQAPGQRACLVELRFALSFAAHAWARASTPLHQPTPDAVRSAASDEWQR